MSRTVSPAMAFTVSARSLGLFLLVLFPKDSFRWNSGSVSLFLSHRYYFRRLFKCVIVSFTHSEQSQSQKGQRDGPSPHHQLRRAAQFGGEAMPYLHRYSSFTPRQCTGVDGFALFVAHLVLHCYSSVHGNDYRRDGLIIYNRGLMP